ncbi:MAG: hypothetical protein IPK04_15635 [Bdellovibrionales bacterium]|nr:hypothetical protein [Bdellovibrionales bacterium]
MSSIIFSVMKGNSIALLTETKSLEELATLIQSNDWSHGVFKDSKRLASNFISADVIVLMSTTAITFGGKRHLSRL